jgi:hypothetical protein
VKIVAQLLPFLPRNHHYHVIFMERDLDEVVASQNAMLARQGRRGAEWGAARLQETYQSQLDRVRSLLACRSEMRTLFVNYDDLLTDTPAGVERLALFAGEPFDRRAATESIRPQLRRQKA